MADTNEVKDLTYTLNSETSNYDKNNILLSIKLPEEDPLNTYKFTIYDVSQVFHDELYNGFFIIVKKTNDNGNDLGEFDDLKDEIEYSFDTSEKIQLYGQSGYTPFHGENPDVQSFVIVYHCNSEDDTEKLACAVNAYNNVPAMHAQLISNGNFQETMILENNVPKKVGMSLIPRK